ncbi:MAG: hypothetical protein LBU43_04435, partial [Candidatus Accumulibacter sp.]|nr:hypothetical protein [Accumulibacter sp.]
WTWLPMTPRIDRTTDKQYIQHLRAPQTVTYVPAHVLPMCPVNTLPGHLLPQGEKGKLTQGDGKAAARAFSRKNARDCQNQTASFKSTPHPIARNPASVNALNNSLLHLTGQQRLSD